MEPMPVNHADFYKAFTEGKTDENAIHAHLRRLVIREFLYSHERIKNCVRNVWHKEDLEIKFWNFVNMPDEEKLKIPNFGEKSLKIFNKFVTTLKKD